MSALVRWVVLLTAVSMLTGCGGCGGADEKDTRGPGVAKSQPLKKPSALIVIEDAGTD